jgi:glycosyltransferase involved in cell wall biosynthesis
MKILQVCDVFSPEGGGVASVVHKLSSKLAELGHDVCIYTTDHMENETFLDALFPTVKVIACKTLYRLGGLNIAPSAFKKAKSLAKSVDVIHFHSYTSFINIPLAYYAIKYKIPMVIDVHGNLPSTDNGSLKSLYHRLFGSKMFKNAALFVAETKVGKEEYLKLGVPEHKVRIAHPGFDVSDMQALPSRGTFREAHGVSASQHIIFFLGRLHKIKGVDFLTEAFVVLADMRDDVVLVLAGPDDGFKDEIEALITKRGIQDRIVFPGFMNLEQKKQGLVDADVFVQPSRYEQGIAHTTIEALLCSTPVVATGGNGAAEDIEHMQAGKLVPFGDTRAFAAAIDQILTDPKTADKLTENGKLYIEENLSLDKTVLTFESMLQESIELKI